MSGTRAALYCRCSTEEESQADALRSQVWEGESCIREHGWILSERYVEAKSGTTTKGRNEYKRLFEDLIADKFDLIVIKSQDRLMRNVKDWYLFLDRMLSCKKRLFMYMEQKFYTADDALITGIKAILAEEYSRELSKKINNAHRHRQLSGEKAMLTSRTFGFFKQADGTLALVEEEAEIIREIYAYCLAGYGSRRIANIFSRQGYVKRTGFALSANAVRRIIRNPLYRGILVMNRRHYDFESKKTIQVPEEEWIFREGIIPAIVDGELWERANQAMNRRAGAVCGGKMAEGMLQDKTANAEKSDRSGIKKGKPDGTYALSGKLICACCNMPYYRTWRQGYRGKEEGIAEWKCRNYVEKGRGMGKWKGKGCAGKEKTAKEPFLKGCSNVHLDEQGIFSLLEQVNLQYCPADNTEKKKLIDCTVFLLKKVLNSRKICRGWDHIEREEQNLIRQKDILLTKLLEGVISDRDYRKRDGELEQRIFEMQKEKEQARQSAEGDKNLEDWIENRIEKIRIWLENGGIERAKLAQLLQDIQVIRVHGWQVEICFKQPNRFHFPENFTLRLDYPFLPETERGRYLDRRRIMEQIRSSPQTTAKKIAGELGRSVYIVRNRMAELKRGGYICFCGRGGQGRWEILRELPDKEESLKNGGL